MVAGERAHGVICGRYLVKLLIEPVLAPLPHATLNIVQSKCIWRLDADFRTREVRKILQTFTIVPVKVQRRRPGSASVLPLCFDWQMVSLAGCHSLLTHDLVGGFELLLVREPNAEGHCFVPSEVSRSRLI